MALYTQESHTRHINLLHKLAVFKDELLAMRKVITSVSADNKKKTRKMLGDYLYRVFLLRQMLNQLSKQVDEMYTLGRKANNNELDIENNPKLNLELQNFEREFATLRKDCVDIMANYL